MSVRQGLLIAACLLAACSASPRPPSSTLSIPVVSSGSTTTSAPTTSSSSPSTTTGGDDRSFRCTEVIGFSQTGSDNPLGGGWYTDGGFEELPGIDGDSWQLRWRDGGGVTFWIDPAYDGWSERRVVSPCAEGPVDRVVFQLTDRLGSEAEWVEALQDLVGLLEERYPGARIDLIPIAGGPRGEKCPAPNESGLVHATEIQPLIIGAIAMVAGGEVRAGPVPSVADCSQYRDKPGHLTHDGARFVAEQMGNAYAG